MHAFLLPWQAICMGLRDAALRIMAYFNPLTVRSQFDDQSLECHLKYAIFTQKSPKSPKNGIF